LLFLQQAAIKSVRHKTTLLHHNGAMSQFASLVAQYGIETLLQHSHALVAWIEKDGNLLAWNPAFESLAKNISTKNSLQDFLTSDSQEACVELFNSVCTTQSSARGNLGFMTQGQDGHARYDCVLLPLPDGQMLFFAELAFYDHEMPDKYHRLLKMVTSLERDYDKVIKILMKKQTEIDGVVAQANEVSHIDVLTNIPNRRQVINDLQREVLHADRYKTPLSISMLDIDHFKQINDTYGHLVGDDALRALSKILQEHVRTPDIVGRYGGEEFLILLPNSSAQAASEQAMRLCKHIREHILELKGNIVPMTVSIGIAEYQIGSESWDKLLSRADSALYQAKNNGRDRWAIAER
jgi:diguanylate cyclase (GGDEF)-like protein